MPLERAEEARAAMVELAPEGFEERERGDELELAVYTDAHGGSRVARAFGAVREDAVPDDWRDRWRTFHRPVRAGPFWIGSSWEEAPMDAIPIVIDPGLAFGTGAHATTRLCLELLQELRRGSLLDAGCGSGVLAIAAVKLGFEPVHALDDDPLAVETARANAEANSVAVATRRADVVHERLPAVEAAVANIELGAVEALATRIDARELVTSGYLESDRPRVQRWRHEERRVLESWAADVWRRPGPDRRRHRPSDLNTIREVRGSSLHDDCLFCRLYREGDHVRKGDGFAAIRDIAPKAPTHLLVIPERHVETFRDVEAFDGDEAKRMLEFVAETAREAGLEDYRVVVNVGPGGGQTVFHLHWHVLGGRAMGEDL